MQRNGTSAPCTRHECVLMFYLYSATVVPSSEPQGGQEGVTPTVDVGDGNADIIGTLLCHRALQCASFLNKVRCFVCV